MAEDYLLLFARKISDTGVRLGGRGEAKGGWWASCPPTHHLQPWHHSWGDVPWAGQAACSSNSTARSACTHWGQAEHWISHFTLSLLDILMSGRVSPLILMAFMYLLLTPSKDYKIGLSLGARVFLRIIFLGKGQTGKIPKVKLTFFCKFLSTQKWFCDGNSWKFVANTVI